MKKLLFFLLTLALPCGIASAEEPIRVGSKAFTESVILGEVARHLAALDGFAVTHSRALGGSRLVWNALLAGEVDLYPDYSGTLIQETLQGEKIESLADLKAALKQHGVEMTGPLGFNNTYALGMMEEKAQTLGIKTITELAAHPALRFGFSNEFMNRADGWPGLRRTYRLPQQNVRGIDHDLAYQGIEAGRLDVIDIYRTDAEIAYYGLRILTDDRDHFPAYEAVYLYRTDLAERAPALVSRLNALAGALTEARMSRMNAAVKINGQPEAEVAADFVAETTGGVVAVQTRGFWQRLYDRTLEHLALVGISLFAAILVAIPLGILAVRKKHLGRLILSITGILQTVPSLALLVFMIPLLGIGGPPAIAALFLYSLLPIVRNTHAGLSDISPAIQESAIALGLPSVARLRLIELPIALPLILAGIKTAAVINVGTATLGALIGAGGYGQPILTGIRLDDMTLILEGAVPAALLALLVTAVFDAAERLFVSRGLRA